MKEQTQRARMQAKEDTILQHQDMLSEASSQQVPEIFKEDDIAEVDDDTETEEDSTIHGGTVKPWKRIESSSFTRARLYIAGIILAIWSIGVIVGLARYAATGDLSILVYSPPALMVPLVLVLRYFFQKRE